MEVELSSTCALISVSVMPVDWRALDPVTGALYSFFQNFDILCCTSTTENVKISIKKRSTAPQLLGLGEHKLVIVFRSFNYSYQSFAVQYNDGWYQNILDNHFSRQPLSSVLQTSHSQVNIERTEGKKMFLSESWKWLPVN